MTAAAIPRFGLPRFSLSAFALPMATPHRRDGSVFFVDITDEEVIRVLNAHGMSRSPLGLTTDETGQITSFEDWFVGNETVRFVNLSQFPNIQDADLRGTYASVEFGTSLEDLSSLMLDDEDEEVPAAEIAAYLAMLKEV